MQKLIHRLACALFALLLFAQLVQAQPLEQHGCHFYKKSTFNPNWTPEQQQQLEASNARSDTFDILHYNIFTDISNFSQAQIKGRCTVQFSPKMAGINKITLDLLGLTVDSIKGASGAALSFTHQGIYLNINLPGATPVGDTSHLTVWYHGTPIQSPSDFGGVYFEQDYIYNLSIGLTDDPHNFGHAWFPCFDNFEERSTYELSFLTALPYRSYAVGVFQGEQDMGNNQVLRSFKMDLPVTTYQVSFAAANYAEVQRVHEGAYGQHPLLLLSKPGDTTKLKNAFLPYMGDAIDCFESWYGPYAWDKVGYAMATRGAMENPGNTIYPVFLIDAANLSSHLNIMTHELAHNWWGNVVTVGSEQDMWIKEGPAEYGAHLFVEYFDGEKDFISTLRGNNYTVLKNANYDVEGFLPLSPMPHAHTYGTHTYNKGAMVMHNLRAYMGDTLFHQGMSHLQQSLRFEAMSAYRMRDSLIAATGVDLHDFFEDWIFSPGFSDFAVDSVYATPGFAGNFIVHVFVRQGVRAAPHLHNNVPVEVNFRAQNGETTSRSMVVSGASGDAVFEIPFYPDMTYLNGHQKLNTACMSAEKTITANGAYNPPNLGITFTVKHITAGDSVFTWVDHHWSAADKSTALPSTVRLSTRHYWTIDGIWPSDFVTSGLIRYNRKTDNSELDADLCATTEDSLILVWRPNGHAEWQKARFYTKLTLGSLTDGNGVFRVDTILRGEYAFANGSFDPMVDTQEPDLSVLPQLDAAPNPTEGDLSIFARNIPGSLCRLELFDMIGNLQRSEQLQPENGALYAEWNIQNLPAGTYVVRVITPQGQTLAIQKIQKI